MRRFIVAIALVQNIADIFCFTCMETGTFPNRDDVTCQTYIFCLRLSDGVFIENYYNCTSGTLYNPELKSCSKNFPCGSYSEQTTQISITTKSPDVSSCVSQGTFPDQSDSICSTYYTCFYISNGLYIKQYFTCPSGSKFNPKLQICSTSYECGSVATTEYPTATTTEKQNFFKCTAQGKFPIETDSTCSFYYYCAYLMNGEYVQQAYQCAAGKKFDPTLQTCNSIYQCNLIPSSKILQDSSSVEITTTTESDFKCPAQGKFPIERDITCNTYYYCVLLTNNQYVQQTYKCATGQKFDPKLQTCSTNYLCNIKTTTEITLEASSIEISTSAAEDVKCAAQGKFPIKGDTNCTKYYICLLLPNGNYVLEDHECGTGQEFDPNLQTCSSNYQCNVNSTTENSLESSSIETPTSVSGNFKCTAQGKFPIDTDTTCNSYYYCVFLTNGEYVQQMYKCATGQKFDPNLQTCSTSYQCNMNSTTEILLESSSIIESSTSAAEDVKCIAQGKFPIEEDINCTKYYNCLLLPNGEYVQREQECGTGQKFDPNLQTCSTIYQCNLNATTEIPLASSSIETLTSAEEDFKCTDQGKFPIEGDTNCTKYYYCLLLPNGDYVEQDQECGTGQKFDPNLQTCSTTYQCNLNATTEIPSASSSMERLTSADEDFKCTAQGKFPVEIDTTCSSYYYCVFLTKGEYVQQVYKCATGKKFDPELQTCSPNYQCNINTSRTLGSSAIETSTSVTESFQCSVQGKFSVESDQTCSSYYYCVYLANGKYAQQIYKCASGKKFDPKLQTCDQNYNCTHVPESITTQANELTSDVISELSDSTKINSSTIFLILTPSVFESVVSDDANQRTQRNED